METKLSGSFVTALAGICFAGHAFALGSVGLDSAGFLKTSQTQNNQSFTLNMGFDVTNKESRYVETGLEINAISELQDQSSLTFEANKLYLATSTQLLPYQQLTVGRRIYRWNESDRVWNLGLWSPRFVWDPLQPQTVGLGGAFYTANYNGWNIRLYGSPVAIPERGYPFQEKDGRIVSSNRFWNELPGTLEAEMSGPVTLPIKYSLHMPDTRDIVSRPNGAVAAGYENEKGIWVMGTYGRMPVHQPEIAADAYLDVGNFIAKVDLYPRFRLHDLYSFEAGYRAENWSLFGSVTREIPQTLDTQKNWITTPIGPAWIATIGAQAQIGKYVGLSGSILDVNEEAKPQSAPELGAITVPLPTRFSIRKAFQFGVSTDLLSPGSVGMKWLREYVDGNDLLTFDAKYPIQNWVLNIGADFMFVEGSEGFVTDVVNNDRVRGKITYAF